MNNARSSKCVSLVDLDPTLAPLLGEYCWSAEWCRWTNLTFKFGRPEFSVRREPRPSRSRFEIERRRASRRLVSVDGDWYLCIYFAHWRILRAGEHLASGTSSFTRMELALADVKGQRLVAVHVNPQTGATTFQFDLDTSIEARRMEKDTTKEVWMILARDGVFRAVLGNGQFVRKEMGA